MGIARDIRKRIDKFPLGKTFGYDDLGIAREDYLTAAKALERLQTSGILKKISKGKFYKPEQTVFGELKPTNLEQLRPYLFENGKRVAYITGISLYNQMGLTTQVANRIKIASRKRRIYIKRGALQAGAVKSYADVSETNYQLLGILDALKDIKQIPDSTVVNSVKILSRLIKEQNASQLKELIKLALLYPPRVRALLGAILDNMDNNIETSKLKDGLNPLTKFRLGLNQKDLPTIKNWNIV